MPLNSISLLVFVMETQCSLGGIGCIFNHYVEELETQIGYSCNKPMTSVQ